MNSRGWRSLLTAGGGAAEGVAVLLVVCNSQGWLHALLPTDPDFTYLQFRDN